MLEMKRGTKQGDPLLQMALKDVTRWQKIEGMGICSGDSEPDCLRNLRFADDALLFSASLVQIQKNDVRLQADYQEGRIANPTGQDENSQQFQKFRTEEKRWRLTTLKFDTLSACERATYLEQTVTFPQQDTAEIKTSNQGPPGHRSTDTNKS